MDTDEFRLFKTVFEQTPVSTQIFTPDGETILVNTAWETLWHIPFKKVKTYNILKDKQLIETGVMPYVKRAFKGESVDLPAIKYVPSRTVDVKDVVPFRWLAARMYPIHDSAGKIAFLVLQHEDITERREASETRGHMEAIVESSGDVIVSKDLSGIIKSWNKAAEKLFGYTKAEAVGKHITLIIPEELRKEEDEIIAWIKSGKRVEHFETIRMGKTGKRIQVSLTISPVKDAEGKIIGASKIARDITEQKKAEETLRQSEELFRVVTSLAPVGIFMTDKDGNCLFVNKKWSDLAGMTFTQAMGAGWGNALHPEDRERVFAEWYKAAKTGKPFKMEYRFITPKGKVSWVSGTAISLKDSHKETTGYMGTVTDITDRKLSEDNLRESEERLRIALDAGKIGVWDWNIKTNHLTWTENVYAIHGVSPKSFQVTFKNFARLIHPEDRERVERNIQDSIAGHPQFIVEFRIITPAGETRWIHTSARIMRGAKKKAERMLGATIDITARKDLEQEKSDFLSMASHELKTPLTSLKIFLDLLESHLPENSKTKVGYYLFRITEQIHRLGDLINDLLDVSRIETGKLSLKKEKFRIDELLFDTVESIRPSAKDKKIVFKNRTRMVVKADRYRLYQVIINLLTNAIKYSPKGNQIIVNVKKNKKDVLVSVQDFGIGINPNKQQKIFDKLYQVSDPMERTFPGLGLGLYISKEIIERHGGKIWVESKGKGKGSTFFFSLPTGAVE